MRNPALSQFLVLMLLCMFVSASISYLAISKYDIYDPATGGRDGDVGLYIRLFNGESPDAIIKPFRYRIFTAFMARFVPFLPDAVAVNYDITPEKIIAFKFGMVNLLGLTLTGITLFYLLHELSFSMPYRLIGVFLFYTSFNVVNYAAVPLAEAWAYAFLTLGVYAIVKRWPVLLLLACGIGVFAKETTLLLPVVVLLVIRNRTALFTHLLACVPGILAYGIFRWILFPTEQGYSYGMSESAAYFQRYIESPSLFFFTGIDMFLTYGAVWMFVFVGFWVLYRSRSSISNPQWVLLKRLGWFIPIVCMVPAILNTTMGRVWFLSFPAAIPVALVGLEYVLEQTSRYTPAMSEARKMSLNE